MTTWSPLRSSGVGTAQALQWLIAWGLLAVYATAITRYLLSTLFLLILSAVGAPGLLLYASVVLLVGPGVFFWLGGLLTRALLVPTIALETGACPAEVGTDWKRLLTFNGVLGLALASELSWAFTRGSGFSLAYKLGFFLSMVLLLGFSFLALTLGRGAESPALETDFPAGKAGRLVRVLIRVCLWANFAFLMLHALCSPFIEQALAMKAGVWAASAGTLYALLTSQLKQERTALVISLGASAIFGATLGPWASAPAGLVFIVIPQLLQGRGSARALVRAWGFSMGQTTGKLAGALVGMFFLGAEGGPIGAVLGESLGGVICYQMAGEMLQPGSQAAHQ